MSKVDLEVKRNCGESTMLWLANGTLPLKLPFLGFPIAYRWIFEVHGIWRIEQNASFAVALTQDDEPQFR